jgi:hypothetical protein
MAKMKIPKSVAGVKIPKKVRRKAKKAVKMAESPVVREFAAAALGAAARAKGARVEARGARTEAKAARLEAAAAFGGGGFEHETVIEIDGDRLVETIRAAALNGLRSFIEGLEEGLRDADARAGGGDARRSRRRSGAMND